MLAVRLTLAVVGWATTLAVWVHVHVHVCAAQVSQIVGRGFASLFNSYCGLPSSLEVRWAPTRVYDARRRRRRGAACTDVCLLRAHARARC
jgi:hypothetical protein